jgi:hypothetical protein
VGTPVPSQRGGKGNRHHYKNPARGNRSSISLSEDYCWSSRRKNSKPELQEHKGLKPLPKTTPV